MASHIHEGQMGRELRVGSGICLLDVTGLRVLEARTHAMSQEQVEGGLRGSVAGCLAQEERPQWVLLGESVLNGFDLTGSRDGPGDERNPHRLERSRRQGSLPPGLPKSYADRRRWWQSR